MILDTCFLIDLMQGDQKAKDKLDRIYKQNEEHYISALSIFELFSGVAQSSHPISEKHKVREVLKGQLIIPLNQSIAEIGGTMFGNQILAGEMTTVVDVMIAASAKEKGQAVLTRNIKDFNRISGVTVETY